jgi:HK97 gp10 family phage protein
MKGLDALIRKLDALGGSSDAAVRLGILQATKKVQGDAKLLAPVDTGDLRKKIFSRMEVENGEPVGIVYTNVEYAPYVEFGTGQRGEASPSPPKWDGSLSYRYDWVGMTARPFLYPALAQNKVLIPQIIAAQLRKAIQKRGGV